jgi:hypothetical protein
MKLNDEGKTYIDHLHDHIHSNRVFEQRHVFGTTQIGYKTGLDENDRLCQPQNSPMLYIFVDLLFFPPSNKPFEYTLVVKYSSFI